MDTPQDPSNLTDGAELFLAQRFSYASTHAARRISERISLSSLQLMSMLDNEGYVDIGHHAGLHRRHLLFYSPKDDCCFVAIQDARYGKVVTVLPLDYHRKLAWAVSLEQCELAKLRYDAYHHFMRAVDNPPSKASKVSSSLKPDTKEHAHKGPKKYRSISTFKRTYKVLVQAMYVSESLAVKRKTIMRIAIDYYIDDFQSSVKSLLQQPDFYTQIDIAILKKNLFYGSIYSLIFQLNKDITTYHTLRLRDRYEAEQFAARYYQQRAHMRQLLSSHYRPHLRLNAPASTRLLRLACHESFNILT
ncbi:MAG: hypothetical protein Q4P13_12115 [Psychrobacter sp.]|nr:hypothetical protein [Psychrobacter sp.]